MCFGSKSPAPQNTTPPARAAAPASTVAPQIATKKTTTKSDRDKTASGKKRFRVDSKASDDVKTTKQGTGLSIPVSKV